MKANSATVPAADESRLRAERFRRKLIKTMKLSRRISDAAIMDQVRARIGHNLRRVQGALKLSAPAMAQIQRLSARSLTLEEFMQVAAELDALLAAPRAAPAPLQTVPHCVQSFGETERVALPAPLEAVRAGT